MARESNITQTMINAAADAILAGGTRPSARSVRAAIGFGSMSTILRLLQVWQDGQTKHMGALRELPPTLHRSLIDFIQEEIGTAKVEWQAELEVAQQTIHDFMGENERLARQAEDQAEAISRAQVERGELLGRLSQMESHLSRVTEDLGVERHAAETSRTELAKSLLRLENVPRIEAEFTQLRSELENERRLKVAAEQVAAVALARLEAMQDRATKAEASTAIFEKESRTIAEESNSCRLQVQAQQTALDAAAREVRDLRQQLVDLRAETKNAIEAAAELRGQLNSRLGKSPPSV